MDRSRHCAACGIKLEFLKREHIQLGKTGFLLGDWPNLLAGALDAEIWVCPGCGKLDFYLARPEEEMGTCGIAKVRCSACGVEYDMDYPKCPNCGAKNMKW